MARVELMCRMTEIFKDPLLSDATCQAWERFVRLNKCVRDSGSMQDGHSARCVSARNLFPGRVICGTCVCFTGPSRANKTLICGREEVLIFADTALYRFWTRVVADLASGLVDRLYPMWIWTCCADLSTRQSRGLEMDLDL